MQQHQIALIGQPYDREFSIIYVGLLETLDSALE